MTPISSRPFSSEWRRDGSTSNLYDFDPGAHALPTEQLTPLDQWILGEFLGLSAEVRELYPYIDDFAVTYAVRFPKGARGDRIVVAGVLGRLEFDWSQPGR